MMESQAQVRLVFAGELIEGHEVDDAMRCFGELARLQGERLAAVFSGRRTVLKKIIDREEADLYVARLRRIGMHVLMEPLEPPPTPSAPVPFLSDPVLSPMTGPSPLATGPLHSFLNDTHPGAWTHPPASTAPQPAGFTRLASNSWRARLGRVFGRA